MANVPVSRSGLGWGDYKSMQSTDVLDVRRLDRRGRKSATRGSYSPPYLKTGGSSVPPSRSSRAAGRPWLRPPIVPSTRALEHCLVPPMIDATSRGRGSSEDTDDSIFYEWCASLFEGTFVLVRALLRRTPSHSEIRGCTRLAPEKQLAQWLLENGRTFGRSF